MATKYIPSDYINNGVGEHKYDQGAANSVAFDPASSFAYVAGESKLSFNQSERIFFFKGSGHAIAMWTKQSRSKRLMM